MLLNLFTNMLSKEKYYYEKLTQENSILANIKFKMSFVNSLPRNVLEFFLFITLPAQNIREVIKYSSLHNENHHIIICSKGIEISSSKFLTDVFQEMMPFKSISILSGPSFSNEVSQIILTKKNVNRVLSRYSNFNWIVEIKFLPGVTDNIATTVKEIINDNLKISRNPLNSLTCQ